MTLEQLLISKFQTLPPHRKQELVDFAEFLAQKSDSLPPLKSIRGICADLKLDLTEEDIQEARREMWANFPNKTKIRGLWKDIVVTNEDLEEAKKAVFKNFSE